MANSGKAIVEKIRNKFGTVKHYCKRQSPPFPVQSFYKFINGTWGTRAGTEKAGTASNRYRAALIKDKIMKES